MGMGPNPLFNGDWTNIMQNLQKINSNKDHQETAIYAFTIVTVIFLPLSSVATILGMNTKDIRGMEFNQWVFWATALPLTATIIVICLLWAGKLQKYWPRLMSSLARGAREKWLHQEMAEACPAPKAGYYQAPAPVVLNATGRRPQTPPAILLQARPRRGRAQ